MTQRITDVRVRRTKTFQDLGRVSDSILELDGLVRDAVSAPPDGDVFEFELGLSRLLYTNTLLLAEYGDPDLIVSSADAVVRLIMSNGPKVNTLPDDRDFYIDILRSAATIAMREHASQGRAETARWAGQIAIGTWVQVDPSQLPSLIRAVSGMPPTYSRSIVRAAAYYSKLTGELGQHELSRHYRDFAREVDADLARRAEENWPGIGIGKMTMAAALQRARGLLGVGQVPDEILLLGGSGNAQNRYTTTQRCPRTQWATSAAHVARIVAQLEPHPELVTTLGMEAHLLYASSLAAAADTAAWQVADSRQWMRLLQNLITAFEHDGDQAICHDLERWKAVTSEVINPYRQTRPG